MTIQPDVHDLVVEIVKRHHYDQTNVAMLREAVWNPGPWPKDREKITRQLQGALGVMSRCACPACENVFQQLTARWWSIHFGGHP
jgi:hypothetical protein